MNAPREAFYDHALRERLWNWGRFARQEMGGPDGSCANPLYEQFVWHDDVDSYGVVTVDTVIVPQEYAAKAELEPVDEQDAESVDFMVRQLSRPHRAVLCVRYVLRERCKTPEAKDRLNLAVWELGRLFADNRMVVEAMR